MQELEFWLDGKSSKLAGIEQQSPFSFSAAVPRVKTVRIAGKSGDLHIDEQTYDNRKGTVKCFTLVENAGEAMASIMSFLLSGSNGYRKLETSDDPDHYWEARVSNAGEIALKASLLNPFTIEFDCKPYRRIKIGDEALFPENGGTIYNPTGFKSEPLIYYTVSGDGYVRINNNNVHMLSAISNKTMVLDSDIWAVYPDGFFGYFGYNETIQAETFPLLLPDNNVIAWGGGVTVTKVVPRWRTL